MKVFKRTSLYFLILLIILSAVSLFSACSNKGNVSQNDNISVGYVSVDNDISDIEITDDENVIKAIANIAESFGIKDAEKELKVESVTKLKNEKYYRIQQYYNDIPVYGKDIRVSVDEGGMVNTISSNVIEIPDSLDTKVTASQDQIQKSISRYFAKNEEDSYYFIPNLEDCQQFICKNENDEFILCYLVKTGTYDFLVDAKTGGIIYCFATVYENYAAVCYNGDGSQKIDGYYSETDGQYYLINDQRGIAVFTYNKTNSKGRKVNREFLTSKDAYFGNSADSDEVKQEYEKGVTLFNNVIDIYDFFNDTFGEKGYDQYIICYNDGFDWGKNALGGTLSSEDNEDVFGYISVGHKTGVDDIDVLAHEYTHIISRYHVNWAGGKENGAINEAYSDIFGEIIESKIKNTEPDWIMKGDNIKLSRNMISPSSSGYPEKVTDKNKSGEDYSHAYSTVISHAAYSMWNGIDGDESKKIDIDTLAEIWYRALLLLHSDADFEQCANKVYEAAKSIKTVTDEQLECIIQAFKAAGIDVSVDSFMMAGNKSTLFVKDTNLKYYDNYHLEIYDLLNKKTVVSTDVTDAKGYALNLQDGRYRVTVTDNDENGSDKEFSFTLSISKLHFNRPIVFYTDFGGILVEDFSIPTEKTLTLGELGVIEPELKPEEATSYSIKWSSSDETVATVSPTGEAGIITSIKKGTTTITAELTSGEKTITKTTLLRVTSKARDTVLVLDVSGSMSGEPMAEMKQSAIKFCNDLLKDEYNNRVGIVFYDNDIYTIDLTDDLNQLINRIEAIGPGGTTNMEGGLAAANRMLQNQSKPDTIKNVVVMADGLPNQGKTSYSGSMPSGSYSGYYTAVSYANAVIDTARAMMANYNIYSLGFFHDLSGEELEFGIKLMQRLTDQTDGYYQVDRAEDLQFAFGDISEDINVGSKIVINIACPVDVRVTYGDETLSSANSNFCGSTSFGTLQLLGKDKDIKVVSVDSDKEYKVELTGTGEGKMDYSVNYFDESEQLTDYRSFESVPITPTTLITSDTDNSAEDIALNIDEDGDGEVDTIWTAEEKSEGEISYQKNPPEPEPEPELETPSQDSSKPEKKMPVWVIVLICVGAVALAGGGAAVVVVLTVMNRSSDGKTEETIIPVADPITCPKCGKAHPHDQPCDCEKEEPITERTALRTGFIQVTSGSMNGFTVPIGDGETICLGKDGKFAHLVFSSDYRTVSRMHCTVTYDGKAGRYYVVDTSSNGTYLIGHKRLEKGKRTLIRANTVLLLANEDCTVLLG